MSRTLAEQLDRAFEMEFGSLTPSSIPGEETEDNFPARREETIVDTSDITLPEDEIEFVKRNMMFLIQKGMSSIHDMSEIARSTEKFGAFETLNSMISGVAQLNTQYLEINKKFSSVEQNNNNIQNQQNNFFIGNASDISSLLKSRGIDENSLIIDMDDSDD